MSAKQKQIDKFKQAAREADADMDEKSFDKALGKLAKSEKPPVDNPQKREQDRNS